MDKSNPLLICSSTVYICLINIQFQRCSNPLQQSLNSWELFKGSHLLFFVVTCAYIDHNPGLDCRDDRDWSALRKHTFDNMTGYLVRKEQRIHQKAIATQPDSRELEVPPEKKAKLKLPLLQSHQSQHL